MRTIGKGLAGAMLIAAATSTGAMAQYYPSYADDMQCRQWADQQVAPMRAQANTNVVGSTLGGAALGAALGAAIGGGRGAGIGAASGAIAGTGAGAANAQYDEATIQ